jgi:hypothetical protein
MPTGPRVIAAAPACASPSNIEHHSNTGRRNSTERRSNIPAADVAVRKLFKPVRRERNPAQSKN